MNIARSTFYEARKVSPAKQKDRELADAVAQIQQRCFFTIGRRRMGTLLRKQFGMSVGETRLQRVMSRYGLTARIRQVRRAKPCAGKATTKSLPGNMLNREFRSEHPLTRLVTDVTYIPYYEGGEWRWGYLSLVQDLFDRSIVSWVYAKTQDAKLSCQTLRLLLFKGVGNGSMLHSDRGNIYTANPFMEMARHHGIIQSFSRTGNCHDNATMECFNSTLKVESLYNPLVRKETPSFRDQQQMIAEYIRYYNEERPCSVLGNLTPQEYRERYLSRAAS